MKQNRIARHLTIPVSAVAVFLGAIRSERSSTSGHVVDFRSKWLPTGARQAKTAIRVTTSKSLKSSDRILISFFKRRPLQRCVSMPQTDMLLIQSRLSGLRIVILHMRNSEYSSNHLVPFPPGKVNWSAREGLA